MPSNDVQSELQNIVSRIKKYWGNDVSNLDIVKITDIRYLHLRICH
jgi:hypothetical protein